MSVDSAKVFDSLEKKVEKLLERYRGAAEENGKLKSRLGERENELEKLKGELASARKAGQKETELAAQVKRFEEENEKVRQRLTKLVETLESIDASRG
jgi:chromosome segregation ATPase